MRLSCMGAGVWLLAVASAAAEGAQAAPRVEFELVTETGFPLNGAQRWIELFRKLDQSAIRIRAARAGDREAVTNRGTERSPSYRVLGILTDRNQLLLPGRKPFSLNDRTAIAQWIKTLQQEGSEGLTALRLAFGLTSEELVAFHEHLAKPMVFTTLDVRAGDAARKIVGSLAVEFDVSAAAQAAFTRNEKVADQLRGLSSGTALAAVLRPLGLVAAPQKKSGRIRLQIGDVREISESWPIGWPAQDSPYRVAPALFEYLTVEINDRPLQEALTAIQARVELPFLYDHNALARHRIDPALSRVSFPAKRTFYKKALDSLLFQARLRSELRVDEAGSPFLWISSTRR